MRAVQSRQRRRTALRGHLTGHLTGASPKEAFLVAVATRNARIEVMANNFNALETMLLQQAR